MFFRMLIDVLIPSGSEAIAVTVEPRSYLELVEGVVDAVGDMMMGPAGAGGVSRSPYMYFVLDSVPCLPRLVIACEETFGFLVEGLPSVLQRLGSGGAASRTRLRLVADPLPAATAALCTLPKASIASSTEEAAAFGAGLLRGASSSEVTPSLPADPRHDGVAEGQLPMVALTASTEGVAARVPLGLTLREMWVIIGRRFPRIIKGVFRLVARPPSFAAKPGGGAVLSVDVDSEDEFAILRPQFIVGTLALEALDQCRRSNAATTALSPLPPGGGSGSLPRLQRKGTLLRDLTSLAEAGMRTTDASASPRPFVPPSARDALHENLGRRREEFRHLLETGRQQPQYSIRGASLD